jgi:type IV secretion system protein VirD4
MSLAAVRLSILLGLLLAALLGSSLMAWKFAWAPELGEPWLGWFYPPSDLWLWWRDWGQYEPERRPFMSGLTIVAMVAFLPLMALRFAHLHSSLKVGRDPTHKEGFGSVKALLKTGHMSRRGDGVVLGLDPQRSRWRQRTLRDNGDGHVMVIGPSRQGKGAGIVVPTLLSHTGSMLVFDPKHELREICGRRRGELGPVFVVDPTDEASSRYNPLAEIRGGNHLIGDCQMTAAIVADSGQGGPIKQDPFWDSAAHKLLTAVLVHVVGSDRPTLGNVWRTCLQIAGNRYPTTSDPFVRATLKAHRSLDGRTRSNIDETLNTHLRFLSDPMIRRMTGASDFRASDLMAGDYPATLFLAIPVSEGKRLRPFTRLVLESLVAAYTTDIKACSDGRPKRWPLLGLVDEFPALGRLDIIERQMPVMAGYGMRLCLVCQTGDQIESAYGTHQSITGNCATIAFIPGYSGNSLATIARWGGQHAVAHSSKQLAAGLRGSSSLSQSEARVPLLDPGEMLERGKREILVWTLGVRPTYLPKLRYWKEREFRGRFDNVGRPTVAPAQAVGETDEEISTFVTDEEDGLSPEDQEIFGGLDGLIKDVSPAVREALRRKIA